MDLDAGNIQSPFIEVLKQKNKNNKRYGNIRINQNIVNRVRTDANKKEETIKKRKPPPINIFNQDEKDTWNLAKIIIPDTNYYIKRINTNKHALIINDTESFYKMRAALAEANTNFFSYTPNEEKRSNILLKGLNQSFEPREVLEELSCILPKEVQIEKLIRFETRRSIQEKRILPIFLLQLRPGSDILELKKIKSLFHQIIHWEGLKKETIQCKRCQRIGHLAANCNLEYRCVKCNTIHDPGKCENKSMQTKDLYCVNCNKEGHPASYKGCPKILEYKNKLNLIINAKKQTKELQVTQTIYAGKNNEKELTDELSNIFDRLDLSNSSNYYIMAGDFNAKHKWSNTINNDRDSRLEYTSTALGKLASLSFDSDHRALQTICKIENDEIELQYPNLPKSLNDQTANWEKFQKILTKNTIEILNIKNLTITEINESILQLEDSIFGAMEKSIPKNEKVNSVDKYINLRIKELRKMKSYTLSRIHRWERKMLPPDDEIKTLKKYMKKINSELKNKIIKSANEY